MAVVVALLDFASVVVRIIALETFVAHIENYSVVAAVVAVVEQLVWVFEIVVGNFGM